MEDFVGLKTVIEDLLVLQRDREQREAEREAQLKRQVLLFDQIGLYHSTLLFPEGTSSAKSEWKHESEWLNNLSWLTDQKIIFPINAKLNFDFFSSLHPDVLTYVLELFTLSENIETSKQEAALRRESKKAERFTANLSDILDEVKANPNDNDRRFKLEKEFARWVEYRESHLEEVLNDGMNVYQKLASILLRIQALKLESQDNKVTAIPLLPLPYYYADIPTFRKSDVIEIVIGKLPLPSATTSWEAIIDYRNDEDTRKSLRALRNWIRKIASDDLPAREIKDELESLMDEFDNHMRMHKLKADTETLQTLVKAPLGLIENLLSLKPTEIINPLFAFRKRKISLMEAEINAPGKEIAYIFKANEAFPDSN